MPNVLFVQDKPRASAKVGPLLRKKGLEVSELAVESLDQLAAGPRPDVVVLDTAGADGAAVVAALRRHLATTPVIVVAAAAGAELPAVTYSPGGKLVDAVLALARPAVAQAQPAPAETETPIETIVALKTAKVRELRQRGVDPFPHRFEKKHPVADILTLGAPLAHEQHSGKELVTAGRVVQLRLMGKAGFFHLQDGSGKAQAYVRLDAVGTETFDLFKNDVHVGDFVGVAGEVFKTKTGEPTLSAKSLTLLAKALRPLPEKWHGLKDPETRYRQRHLDLVSNPDARRIAVDRARIVQSVRTTMGGLGYLEVETPILLTHAGGASARPFLTHHNALDARMNLRIATELHLKRLIVGGLERVYEIGRIFRNEGIDTRHNPEFTTLEAYGAYEDYRGMAALFEKLLSDAARTLGIESIAYRGHEISLKPPFRRLYLPQLWKDLCGADIHDILKGKGFDRAGLLAQAKKLGIEAGDGTPSAKVFERIFDARILPELVQPAFVLDHPTAITPLAKCKPGDESIVERFEFFLGTEELANAYTELNDPLDQRERFEEQARQRQGGDEETDILDEDFVQAMESGMPPTGGIGIGIDRLVMILTGTPSIREVILFPTLKPES